MSSSRPFAGLAFERAREAATRALELAPALGEAHNVLAFVLLYHDWRPEGAAAAFDEARRLAPGSAMTHHWAAAAYAATGRLEEAVASARAAAELDPVSMSVRADLGWYHLVAGQWEEAARQCARALELSEGYHFALDCQERALRELGDHAGALEVARRRLRASGLGEGELTRLTSPAEPQETWRKLEEHRLHQLRDAARKGGVDPLRLAWAYAAVGETDAAFEELNKAVAAREPWLVFLWADRRFKPLWDEPRFMELAERVGMERPRNQP